MCVCATKYAHCCDERFIERTLLCDLQLAECVQYNMIIGRDTRNVNTFITRHLGKFLLNEVFSSALHQTSRM